MRNLSRLYTFGTFHLMHIPGAKNAVSIYEKDYPNRTFVISDLGVVHRHQSSAKLSFPGRFHLLC